MTEKHGIKRRGFACVDVNLLASAKLSKAALWTPAKRLAVIDAEFEISAVVGGLH